MAYPYYLVTAKPKKLERIAKYARSLTGKRNGDPVIAISSMRVVLMPLAVERMIDAATRDPVDPIRIPSFQDIVHAMGAEGVAPISPGRLSELLAAREPAELSVSRLETDSDELFIDGYDWHVKVTHLVEAWALFGGPDRIDWRHIRVGQIDTGFRPIPNLGFGPNGKSLWVLTDLDRNFFPGDFDRPAHLDYATSPRREDSALDPLLGGPNDGHGTRTASVLCGLDVATNHFGAAPRVPYIPVRISDSVIVNHVQEPLALAIEHLVRNGCGVISLSMGMALTYVTSRLRDAIDHAYENGVILVTAAGNVWDPVVAPARLNRTLAVGGCTPALTPWLGSSFGPQVDICAPAWLVRRATVNRKGEPLYGHGDGTSYATPQVAGAAALWLLHRRTEIRETYRQRWQRVEAFKRIVMTTAQMSEEWNTNLYGAGILDAHALLQATLPEASSLIKDQPA